MPVSSSFFLMRTTQISKLGSEHCTLINSTDCKGSAAFHPSVQVLDSNKQTSKSSHEMAVHIGAGDRLPILAITSEAMGDVFRHH
jgi:hypothetical protein